jgi:hypothetical protein
MDASADRPYHRHMDARRMVSAGPNTLERESAPPVPQARTLLDRVARWPSISVWFDGARAALRATTDDRLLGRLDLVTGMLEVEVPPDTARQLIRLRPRLRPTRTGVRVDVLDTEALALATWLIRRRITVERNAGQYLHASP